MKKERTKSKIKVKSNWREKLNTHTHTTKAVDTDWHIFATLINTPF